MKSLKPSRHFLSICILAIPFAYIMSFLFEGRVLYAVLNCANVNKSIYIFTAIIFHFLGQFTCGFFCKSAKKAKKITLLGFVTCLLFMLPFFVPITFLWMVALTISGFASGCAVAAWGYYLRAYTTKNERIKSCADVLIISNLIMIFINVISINWSEKIGLCLCMLCLAGGLLIAWRIPVDNQPEWVDPSPQSSSTLRKPIQVLFLFVMIITINSGLMYQVINPRFEHLPVLTGWYWAVPYIIALVVMRNLPIRMNRATFLYVGMAMIMAAFICFMALGHSAVDYIIIDTLMLGACGIFDLFWWSIIGETLEYAKNPVSIFGIGLSANVFGVLCGDVIGAGVTAMRLSEAQIAVIALCVVCVTLIILPPLNRQLAFLLKSHAYLSAYSVLPEKVQKKVVTAITPLEPLTEREKEILLLLLEGKSNKEIAEASYVTENTVKTHLKSIFSKYGVTSRVELISLILRSK